MATLSVSILTKHCASTEHPFGLGMVLSTELPHLSLTVTLWGSQLSPSYSSRDRLRELNLRTQGYPTCKWQRQTTHIGLSAFQILFNTSHCSSKRRRAFQSPLSWARLCCLLYFPLTALAGTPSGGPSSWRGAGWLAGIRVWVANQAARLILFSVHVSGNHAKLQRGHCGRGWGGWICQLLPSAPRMHQGQHQPVV